MTQQHRTTRTVYRAATEHLTQLGDSRAADETWTVDYNAEPDLANLRGHEEIVAEVHLVVDLADDLSRVERLRADGAASLYFPEFESAGTTLTITPGDLPTIRRALDAIEAEWTRLGVYPADAAAADEEIELRDRILAALDPILDDEEANDAATAAAAAILHPPGLAH